MDVYSRPVGCFVLMLSVAALLFTPGRAACNEKKYQDPGSRFSIAVPDGGTVAIDPLGITVITMPGQAEGSFQQTVKIVAAPMREGTDLTVYVANSLYVYKDIWKVKDDKEALIAGIKARRLVIEQTLPSLTTKVVKYFLSLKGHIFVITCAAEPGSFESQLPVFEALVATFLPFPWP